MQCPVQFTGRYQESLDKFSLSELRWKFRVNAYVLLLHQVYPPFRLAK